MIDYSDHKKVLKAFKEDMDADTDRREKMREVDAFLHSPRGQWEDSIWSKFSNRFRGTFDLCNPLIESIWGGMAKNDFDIRVKPAGDGADKKNARRYDGLIRQIEELSNAPHEYKQFIKGGIARGFDVLHAKHRYVDSDAFHQDLYIEKVPNPLDRLWFGKYEKQTAEDAPHATLLGEISQEDGEKKANRRIVSIGTDRSDETWKQKRDNAVIARIYYKKSEPRTLYLLNDGRVIDDESVLDELALQGISVIHKRERPRVRVYYRDFDEEGWIGKEEKSPFKHLPFSPIQPNFRVYEGKVVSRGAVELRMDEQRVRNYGISRSVDDNALSAKEKKWVGASQAKGRETELTKYSTSDHEIQIYNDVTNTNPPYAMPSNQGSAGLQQVLTLVEQSFEKGSGVYGANPQNNTGLQSGIGLERLENTGQEQNLEYADAAQSAICHLAKILIGAVPQVYIKGQAITIKNEDGSTENITLGERIFDDESGEVKDVIDLHSGVYNVTCSIGATFANRKAEAADRLIKYAGVDPSIIANSKDVLLNNDDTPGMDVVAERERHQMILQGRIPDSQMTEEEKAMVSQKEQPPDPNMLIGQAELIKAQNEAKTSEVNHQVRLIELEQKQQKLDFEEEKQSLELMLKQQMDIARAVNDLSKAVQNLQGTPLAAVPAKQILDLS